MHFMMTVLMQRLSNQFCVKMETVSFLYLIKKMFVIFAFICYFSIFSLQKHAYKSLQIDRGGTFHARQTETSACDV